MNKLDPMTKVFDVLKARSGERADQYLDLEEELMSVFDQQRQRRSRFAKLAIVSVVGLCVTGAVAEAASGVLSSMIKSVTLDTGSGPRQVTGYQTKLNPNGNVDITVTLPVGENSGTVTVDATGK